MTLSRRKRLVFGAAVTLALTILTLAITEGFLALFPPQASYEAWHGLSIAYVLDDEVDWALEPRAHAWGQVNANGFRGPALPFEKPEGTYRIAVLGGSAAFDLGKKDDATWPALLEKRLRAAGRRVEVLNAGTPGYSTWQCSRLLPRVARWNPDMVLVYELFNDSLAFRHRDREAIKAGWKLCARANHGTWASHESKGLDALTAVLPRTTDWVRAGLVRSGLRESAAKNAAFWQDPTLSGRVEPAGIGFYEENLASMASFCEARGIAFGCVTQASLIRADNSPEERRRILYTLRGLEHARLFQAYQQAWEIDRAVAHLGKKTFVIEAHAKIPASLELFDDEVHLNARGSERLAGVVAEGVLERQLSGAGVSPAK